MTQRSRLFIGRASLVVGLASITVGCAEVYLPLAWVFAGGVVMAWGVGLVIRTACKDAAKDIKDAIIENVEKDK